MALRAEWTEEMLGGALTAAVPGNPPAQLRPTPARATAWRGKRAVDVALALVLLVVLAPLMLVAALAVKLTSRGPVFFRQARVGREGSQFRIFKFRTMCSDAEERLASDGFLRRLYVAGGHKIPCELDPRVTRVGRILRTWSIDEVPQLFNVLLGHMSLVGPRPVLESELDRYGEHVAAYLAVRPGLTGVWQVTGRNQVLFPARAELDAFYAHRCGPWLDLMILMKTPMSVLRRQGSA